MLIHRHLPRCHQSVFDKTIPLLDKEFDTLLSYDHGDDNRFSFYPSSRSYESQGLGE